MLYQKDTKEDGTFGVRFMGKDLSPDEIIERLNKLEEVYNIAYNSPELNMCNYHHDDVDNLNDAMIDIIILIQDTLPETL